MARYIDADKLLEKEKPKSLNDDIWINSSFYKTIMNAPTEEVTPIVRCKDCKHRGYTSNGYDRQYIMCCTKLNLDTEIYGDFYCGYAEKMEESEESERE